VTFYRDLLGFTQTYQFPREGKPEHVELRLGESMVALSTPGAIRGVGLPEPSRGQVLELVVWCEDVDGNWVTLVAESG
jgi:lactoylglutathione lyase